MDKKQKASVKRYVSLALAALLTAGLAAMPLLTAEKLEGDKASILTAVSQRGEIQQLLLGGGALEAGEAATVTVPAGVTVTELLASSGDTVKIGDPIARVDKVSVMTAVVEAQKSLDQVGEKLRGAAGKINPGNITIGEDGTILSGGKAIPKDKLSDYADFFALGQQHRDLEQALLSLFRLSQSGVVTAEADGMIADLDKSVLKKLSGSGEGELMLLGLNTPPDGEEDSETYRGFTAVVKSIVAEDGTWNLLRDPIHVIDLPDLSDTSAASTNVMFMTEPYTHEPAVVYTYRDGQWEQVENLKSDDILLFAYSETVEWVIKIGQTGDAGQTGGAQLPDVTIPGMDSLPGDLSGLLGGSTGHGGFDFGAIAGSFSGSSGFGNRGTAQEETLYSTEGIRLCTILPQDTMSVSISVDESDIRKLSVGMTASITLDALPDQSFTGEVTEVSQFGIWNGGSSKFSVTLALPYSEGMLPGMNASAALCLNTLENVVMIPVAALNEQSGEIFVYTGYDAKQEQFLQPVPVTTGVSDGEMVEILAGLEENVPVFYSYYDKVEISNLAE